MCAESPWRRAGRNASRAGLALAVLLPRGAGAQRLDPDTLAWSVCGDADLPTQCAVADLPRYHQRPDSGTFGVAVTRIPAPRPRARQLWFVDGGPGDAASASVGRLVRLLDDPELEILTFDHRGTGGSARLGCPNEESAGSDEGQEIVKTEWRSCIDYITRNCPDLAAMTVNEVVEDIHDLVSAFRVADIPVFVLGVSYGSYLTQRYLLRHPDDPDGVVLDGVVPLDWGFNEFDAGLDHTARLVMSRCTTSPECAAHLGPDPVARVLDLLAKQRAGHCFPLTIAPEITRLFLGAALMVDAVPRAAMPVLVHRLDRCAWYDQMAVLHLIWSVFDELGEPPSHAPVLQRQVAMMDLWAPDAPSTDSLAAALESYVATTAVSASFAETFPIWPIPPAPREDSAAVAPYRGPLLLMQGTLDPTMPVERLRAVEAGYHGEHQHFVFVGDGGHVVVNESACARGMYLAFLSRPAVPPDTACLADVARLDMSLGADDAERLFGTRDGWGDASPVGAALVFFGLYRVGAALLGLWAMFAGVQAARRRRDRSWRWLSVRLVSWVALAAVLGVGLYFLPYLRWYLAPATLLVAILALIAQWGVGRWWWGLTRTA